MNKEEQRQQSHGQWAKLFVETGLSNQFEFIERGYGRGRSEIATVKCKTCGNVFDTHNVKAFFSGKVKNICCHECGMRSDGTIWWTKSSTREEAIEFYLNGHTRQEVKEKFGVSVSQFDNEIRMRGIAKTVDQREEAWRQNLKKASAVSNANAKEVSRQKRIYHLDVLGFDLIDEHEKNGTVRCRKCGYIFERTLSHLTHGNVTCSECLDRAKAEQNRQRKEEIKKQKLRKEAERIAKNPNGLSSYQLSIQDKFDAVHVCEMCGKEYTVRTRMENDNIKYCRDTGCCSRACDKKRARINRRARGFRDNHRHRAIKYGCAYDGSITLKRLIKRDGLKCAICGEQCNTNDHEWTQYFGPTSPTIDHIIPMSKGGGHVWNNVQVAHAICNSIKRDSIEVDAHEAS